MRTKTFLVLKAKKSFSSLSNNARVAHLKMQMTKEWWWQKTDQPYIQEWIYREFEIPAAVFYECARRAYPERMPAKIRKKNWLKLTPTQKGIFAFDIWPSLSRDAIMIDFATRCYHPWMRGPKPSPNAEGWMPPVSIAINLHRHNGQIKKDFEVFV